MRIFRNGTELTDLADTFDNHQLASLSLVQAARDAQIGIGQIAVPTPANGIPEWTTGDRITFMNDAADLILHVGYVFSPHVQRNPDEPAAIETIYRLWDCNRHFIGIRTVDWVRNAEQAIDRLLQWFDTYWGHVDVNTGAKVVDPAVELPPETYTMDGLMNLAAELISGTGFTIFLVPDETDNAFVLHFHEIGDTGVVVTSTISIDDTPGAADNVTVFAPRDAFATLSSEEFKNHIEARSGVGATVVGGTEDEHNDGGLKFEAILDFDVPATELGGIVDALLLVNQEERPTVGCTIGPLTDAQAAAVQAGMLIQQTMAVAGYSGGVPVPIASRTLTIWKDENGVPRPGLWDVTLELAYPSRQPAQPLGQGGQGGDFGRINPYEGIADHFDLVTSGDFTNLPVGASKVERFQLRNIHGASVTIPDTDAEFTLELWEDEAKTVAGSGWSIDPTTTTTDAAGQVEVEITHDALSPTVIVDLTVALS